MRSRASARPGSARMLRLPNAYPTPSVVALRSVAHLPNRPSGDSQLADDGRGVAHHHGAARHILRHNSSSAHYGSLPNGYAF